MFFFLFIFFCFICFCLIFFSPMPKWRILTRYFVNSDKLIRTYKNIKAKKKKINKNRKNRKETTIIIKWKKQICRVKQFFPFHIRLSSCISTCTNCLTNMAVGQAIFYSVFRFVIFFFHFRWKTADCAFFYSNPA